MKYRTCLRNGTDEDPVVLFVAGRSSDATSAPRTRVVIFLKALRLELVWVDLKTILQNNPEMSHDIPHQNDVSSPVTTVTISFLIW